MHLSSYLLHDLLSCMDLSLQKEMALEKVWKWDGMVYPETEQRQLHEEKNLFTTLTNAFCALGHKADTAEPLERWPKGTEVKNVCISVYSAVVNF